MTSPTRNGRKCQRCDEPLTGKQRLWCSGRCRAAASDKKRRAEENALNVQHPGRGSRGKIYEHLQTNPVALSELIAGITTITQIAEQFGVAKSTAARNFNAILAEQNLKNQEWEMDPEISGMLGLDEFEPPTNAAFFDGWLDRQIEAFVQFRTRFFRVKRNQPYLTEPFHRRWIKEILRAIVTGGKLLILSPPRHGKSELLIHFCVWLICRDHDIRIIWVGGNADIASDMVSSVREHLEDNPELVAAVLPPGEAFKPEGKQGVTWQNSKFRVAQRQSGLKGNTMIAVGRTGKILSRDSDFIVSDDIEDAESTAQPAARAATRRWFLTQLSSRKEEHTGWVAIGSRQHADDLYGHLLDADEWATIVDTAHQDDCPHPPYNPALHTDCMLFPQLRTFRWLQSKRTEAAALGQEGLFEMVYLNTPRIEGLQIFIKEEMENCYNRERGIGIELGADGKTLLHLPTDLMLVAGLDPAATGYQAGWIWAWSPTARKLYKIDSDNRLGGGIDAFLTLADQWRRAYRLGHWVIEDKGFQSGYRTEDRVREWANEHNVYLEGHHTGSNKADPNFGVGAMAKLYENQTIDLPFGTPEAREKTVAYVRQALRFVDTPISQQLRSGRRNKAQSDLLMASWFPMKVVRRWQKEIDAKMNINYEPTFGGWNISNISKPPW